MTDVFISYSRTDRAIIERLAAALETRGYSVWWDNHIAGGSKFSTEIAQRLEEARVVVVAWSAVSVASEWVLDEAGEAREQNKLVPILLDDSKPPLGFRQRQAIEFSRWGGDSASEEMLELATTIDSMASGNANDDGAVSRRARSGDARTQPRVSEATTAGRGAFGVTRRQVIAGGGLLALTTGGAWLWRSGFLGGPVGGRKLAVMPFEIVAGDKSQSYLAEGFGTAIRNQLSRNPLLHVAARTSSRALSKSGKTASEICRALGVDFLLNGSVRLFEGRMRVNGELSEGALDRLMLPIEIEGSVENIFDMQVQIASDVVAALTGQRETTSRLQVGGTTDIEAYDAYLRGLELYEAGIDETSDRAALASFDEAVRLDRRFAAAHAMRGRTLALIGNLYGKPEDFEAIYGSAAQSAQRAIDLAPEFADGYAVLGFIKSMSQLDMQAARTPYDIAFELGNGDADILSRYAIFRSRLGDFDSARQAIERASVLDPLNARVFRYAGNIAYDSRQHREAIGYFDKALEIQPGLPTYHYLVGLALLELGKLQDAKANFEAERRFVFQKTGLAIVENKLGDRAAASGHFADLQARQGNKSNYQYLQVLAQWGEIEAALNAMDAAWAARDPGLVLLNNDPLLDPVRDTARYEQLAERIGFLRAG